MMCHPCKGNPKADPPVPPTDSLVACPHKYRCPNCHGEHSVMDKKCPFWRHKFDRAWIDAKYLEVHSSPKRRPHKLSNTPPVA